MWQALMPISKPPGAISASRRKSRSRAARRALSPGTGNTTASPEGRASRSRLDDAAARDPAAGADVAGIDDQWAAIDQQAVIDRVVIGADDRDVERRQRRRGQRGRAPAGELRVFA